MLRQVMVVGVVLLAGVGCSGGGGGSASPETLWPQGEVLSCDEFWAEGTETVQAMFDEGCLDADGQVAYSGSAVSDCADGRELRWNDRGWGFMGEPWHHHTGDERVPPDDVVEGCDG